VTIRTLFAYLFGSRAAIEKFAVSRWSLPIGLLLVFSSGIARYYDNAYLPAEWTVLLRGIAVSTINSFVLVVLAYCFAARGDVKAGFPRMYVSFLGLFWMMAPMAWLYGIPYEHFLTPMGAVNANTWTLGLVSVWRVLLAARVLSVLFGVSAFAMFFPVMLFSDVAMWVATQFAPRPVLDLMGGMQLTEVERQISSSAMLVQAGTLLMIPLWAIATLVAAGFVEPKREQAAVGGAPIPKPNALLALGAVAICGWSVAAAVTQPALRLRHRAEELLQTGRVDDALMEMSTRNRSDYPPVWDAPPRRLFGEKFPPLQDIRLAMERKWPVPWVADMFMEKSWRDVASNLQAPVSEIEYLASMIEFSDSIDTEGLGFHLAHDKRFSEPDREKLREAIARRKRPK